MYRLTLKQSVRQYWKYSRVKHSTIAWEAFDTDKRIRLSVYASAGQLLIQTCRQAWPLMILTCFKTKWYAVLKMSHWNIARSHCVKWVFNSFNTDTDTITWGQAFDTDKRIRLAVYDIDSQSIQVLVCVCKGLFIRPISSCDFELSKLISENRYYLFV